MRSLALFFLMLLSCFSINDAKAQTATFAVAGGCLIEPLPTLTWSGSSRDFFTQRNNSWVLPTGTTTPLRFAFRIRCPNGTVYTPGFNGTVDANGNFLMRKDGNGPAGIAYRICQVSTATVTSCTRTMTPNTRIAWNLTGTGSEQVWWFGTWVNHGASPVRPIPAGTYTDTLTLALYF